MQGYRSTRAVTGMLSLIGFILRIENTIGQAFVEMFWPLRLLLYFFQPSCSHFQLLTISGSFTKLLVYQAEFNLRNIPLHI